uniref:type I-E CRISPR-associated protein Cas7/Cse4/CasC n=1 Tax=uncultured Bifidobacterium sp. TaxID=165187 RepID=UPI0026390CD8
PTAIPELVQRTYGSDPIGPESWRDAMNAAAEAWVNQQDRKQADAMSFRILDPGSSPCDLDNFTAVDDVKQDSDEEGDAGAAMIGDVEFNSATFYRYANVDVDRLLDTLGDANATVQAVTAFIDAFSTTVPNGKINTFAHNTLPDLVVVNLRDTQAVNLAGAFERPIAGDIVANATKALVEREQEIDASYGTTPVHTWVIRVGKDTEAADQLAARQPLRDVLTELGDAIASRLVQE